MARQSGAPLIEKKLISDLSGGLNDTNVSALIKDSEAQTASNVFVNNRGGVEKRYGYSVFTNDPLTFTGFAYSNSEKNTSIFKYVDSSLGDQMLVAVQNGSIILYGGCNDVVPSYLTYTNGTATFTHNSATVTLATGTAEWTTQIYNSDYIQDSSTGIWWEVLSVTNNSTLVINTPYNGTTGTYSYSVRQSSVFNSGQLSNAMFNGFCFYSGNSVDNSIIGYNGTSTRRYNSISTPATMASHQNYLFGAFGSRIRWSTLLDGTSWPSANFLDVSPSDGDNIQTMISWNGVLYVFKRYNIYIVIGNVFDPANPTYQLIKLPNPNNVGAIGKDSVRPYMGRLIFPSYDGIYALDGSGNVENISNQKIRTTIRSILNISGYVSASPCSAIYDNKLWISFKTVSGSNTSNDMTLVLEPNGSWTKHTLAMQQAIVSNTGTLSTMYYINSSTWGIFKVDGTATNDGASAINSTWTSRIFYFPDFSRTTRIMDIYALLSNGSGQAATLKIYDNGGQIGSSTVVTFPGGTTQLTTTCRIAADRDTDTFYLTITDNTSASTFRLMGFIITYEKDSAGSGGIITS